MHEEHEMRRTQATKELAMALREEWPLLDESVRSKWRARFSALLDDLALGCPGLLDGWVYVGPLVPKEPVAWWNCPSCSLQQRTRNYCGHCGVRR